MTDLKTNQSLLKALEQATRPLTAEERHRQRVSFIMGSLKPESSITRAQIESVLANQEGEKANK